jgi:peptide-methionine (S)-S-oxide reductase
MIETQTETATFGGGCFWGIEETFRNTPGVLDTEVGYAGGRTENPTYQQVCSGRTGHAEVVRVTYDPAQISYQQLLDIFFRSHNPTTPNRQGPDVGEQYRSVVFVHNGEQEQAVRRAVEEVDGSGRFRNPVVTQIVPAGPFYRAEEYHQQYLARRGLGACHI